MTKDFSKVSLGFAEFVSQLIHETFDAVINSQFYQIEKFDDIRQMLALSNHEFRNQYIIDSEFIHFQENILTFIPQIGLKLPEVHILKLRELFEEIEFNKIVVKGKITSEGLEIINTRCVNKIAQSKKSKLFTLLNQHEKSKLVVDGGSIKAKLELFCLTQTTEQSKKSESSNKLSGIKPSAASKANFDITEIENKIPSSIKMFEITDKETSLKTIMFDKSDFQKSILSKSNNFNTRLIANPISVLSDSNLISEISINFKIV